jgi:hypothetical protein
MAWVAVTIPRRKSGVAMPSRCAYCYGDADQDVTLRARRRTGQTKGRLTTTALEEHLAVEVPYCRRDAARSQKTRREIRIVGFAFAGLVGLAGFLALLIGLDAPPGVRIVLGLIAGALLGLFGLIVAGLLVRRLPRYRDWGAGLLGVDLAAGAEALTFRFTNATFAAAFRTRNGNVH